MHRDSKPKTSRVQVSLQSDRPVRLRSSNRNLFAAGRGNDKVVRDAQAVSDAFGVGLKVTGDILDRRAKKANLAGTLAANEGREMTAGEKRSDAFQIGYQAVLDDRQVIEMEAEANDLYDSLDTTKMTSVNLASALDKLFAENHKGIDLEDDLDAASMANILPSWERIVQGVLNRHQDDAQDFLQNQLDGALSEASDYELRHTGAINLEVLNTKMFGIYNKTSNLELVDLITGIAVREGKPALIAELQSKRSWKGGAAAPGGIRNYDSILTAALVSARSQEVYLATAGQQQADRDHKRTEQAIGNHIMDVMMSGDIGLVVGQITDAVAEGTMDWQVANQLLRSTNSFKNLAMGFQGADGKKMFELEMGISNLTMDITDLNTAADLDQLGTGQVGQTNYARLAATIRAAENHAKSDPLFKAKIEEFMAVRGAPRLDEDTFPSIKTRRTKSLRKLYELMHSTGDDRDGNPLPGLSIDDAVEAVNKLEEFKPLPDKWWRVGFGGVSKADAIKGWREGGQHTARAIIESYGDEVRIDTDGSVRSDADMAVWLYENSVFKDTKEYNKFKDELEGSQ